MRAGSILRAAALVKPQTPCASAAVGLQQVNRILGHTNPGATCAKSFGDIVAKQASGKAAVYAHLGRAMVFLNRGEDKLAEFDVENAAKIADPATAQKLIASLRFQCAVRLLAEEQRKLTISGATTELKVADMTQAAAKALSAMSEAVGADYSVSVAAGEFFLYYANDAAAAASHFETAIRLVASVKLGSVAAGTADPVALASADVNASTLEAVSGLKSKNIDAEILNVDGDALASLKSVFGDNLSAEQLTLLGSVQACEARGGAIFDSATTPTEKYGNWTSSKAASVRRRVQQISHPLVAQQTVPIAKPTRAFFLEGVSIEGETKACAKEMHILDHLPSVPKSAVTAEDATFFQAFSALKAATADAVPADQGSAAKYYTELAADLMQQVEARAKVGLAEAFTRMNKTSEAEKLIVDVQGEDSYVDMWRLYAAKGELMKKVGRVEDSDVAFKNLHGLRIQAGGNDLPLMDDNRHKSAF